MGNVNYSARRRVLCSIIDKLISNLDFVGDVLAANLVLAKAKCATFFRRWRALAPADGADGVGVVVTRRVAEGSALHSALAASERSARCTAVRVLSAADADVGHALRAVWGADAAANIMEVFVALGEPHVTPLFAALALVHLASATAISVRLVAVGAIVSEALVMRAVLPADGANTCVALLAVGVAESAILLLILGAGR